MPKVHMTEAFIRNAKPIPGQKSTEWVDEEFGGLYLSCREGSTASQLYYRAKVNQRMKHFPLGRAGVDVSLAEARKKAMEIKIAISKGEYADGAISGKAQVLTLDDLFLEFEKYAQPRMVSFKRYEQLYRCHLKEKLGQKNIRTITRNEMEAIHTDLLNREDLAVATANHVAKLARRLMGWAHKRDLVDRNVMAGFAMAPTYNRINQRLEPVQLARLVHVLRTHPNRMVCNMCLWSLATGARAAECRQVKFSQISRSDKQWIIPAEASKSKRARVIPLNDIALSVFDELWESRTSDYLFVTKKGAAYTTVAKSWERIRKIAGLPAMQYHSFRREHATILASQNVSLFSIQTLLGHKDPKTTMAYATVNNRALADAANQVSVFIKNAIEGTWAA